MSRKIVSSNCRILRFSAASHHLACRRPHHTYPSLRNLQDFLFSTSTPGPGPSLSYSSSSSSSSPSASTRNYSSTAAASDGKPIVLDKPDKFRPPSHPSRLNARRIPRLYPGPPLPEAEREAQATRKYPHSFPRQGTGMHWFLTNRWVHLWISLGTLTFLSIITLTQSFLQTSPFAHLTPSISTLPIRPLTFVSEWLNVVRMHQDYGSQQSAEQRRQGIADAQKRRLWRRAHGVEDVDKDAQGVDVRGLVDWDDGLNGDERRRGRANVDNEKEEEGELRVDSDAAVPTTAAAPAIDVGNADVAADVVTDTGDDDDQDQNPLPRTPRPLKKWFGIW